MAKALYLSIILLFFNNTFGQNKKNVNTACQKGINEAKKDAAKGIYKHIDFGISCGWAGYYNWGLENYYEEYLLTKYGIEKIEGTIEYNQKNKCYAKKMDALIFQKYGDTIFEKAYQEAETLYQKEIQTRIDTGFIFTEVDSLAVVKKNNSYYPDVNDCEYYFTSNFFITVEYVIEKCGKISSFTIKDESKKQLTQSSLNCIVDSIIQNGRYKPAIVNGQFVRSKLITKIHLDPNEEE